MKPFLFFLSRKSQLLSSLLLFLLIPKAELITASPAKAQSSTPSLQLAQGNNSLEKKGKDFIALLSGGKYQDARGYFSPELQKEVRADNLESFWDLLKQRYGRYENISSIKFVDAFNVQLLNIDINFQNYNKTITLVFNNESQIIGINIPRDQKDDTIEKLANGFIQALSQGKYLEARFNLHPYLKAEFTPEEIQNRWEKIDKQLGGFKQIVNIQSAPGESPSQADIAIVTIEFNDTFRNAVIIFDSEKQITGVDLENIFTK
jgi:hypothetical protein